MGVAVFLDFELQWSVIHHEKPHREQGMDHNEVEFCISWLRMNEVQDKTLAIRNIISSKGSLFRMNVS